MLRSPVIFIIIIVIVVVDIVITFIISLSFFPQPIYLLITYLLTKVFDKHLRLKSNLHANILKFK